ncbi:MAG: Maf family protein [Ktedonobacterales bacterium]
MRDIAPDHLAASASSPSPAPTLYLASTSPRRRQLLGETGIPFEIFAVSIDEERLSEEYAGPLEQLGEYLAQQKALATQRALLAKGREGLVLAADTTVLLDGKSLVKPVDTDDAIAMLNTLRGRTHVVATGVALAGPGEGRLVSATSATGVTMRDLGDDEIADYVASGDPFDKAGGYSVQHPGFQPVARTEGCYLGVVGLPVCIVAHLLGRGPLPPCAQPGVVDADGASQPECRCIWSATCSEPYPTPDAIDEAPLQP